jgi:hypothetical protein
MIRHGEGDPRPINHVRIKGSHVTGTDRRTHVTFTLVSNDHGVSVHLCMHMQNATVLDLLQLSSEPPNTRAWQMYWVAPAFLPGGSLFILESTMARGGPSSRKPSQHTTQSERSSERPILGRSTWTGGTMRALITGLTLYRGTHEPSSESPYFCGPNLPD